MATVRTQDVKLSSSRSRQRKTVHEHVTKGAIRRLARRGGVKRLSALIYDEMRLVLRKYLENLVRDSVIHCEYFNRKIVKAEDVIQALRYRGQRLYGFDDPPFPISIRSSIVLRDTPSITEESIPSISEIAETPGNENHTEDLTESFGTSVERYSEVSDSLISPKENRSLPVKVNRESKNTSGTFWRNPKWKEEKNSLLIKENKKNNLNSSKASGVVDTEVPICDPVPGTSKSGATTRARELSLNERRKKIVLRSLISTKNSKDSSAVNVNTGRRSIISTTISSDSDDFQDSWNLVIKKNRKS